MPSAIASPSIWWNIGRWVASIVSRRNALPGTATKIGGPCASMARTCIGDVWVRSMISSGSGVCGVVMGRPPASMPATSRAASSAAFETEPGAM
jgi:hypothetical protein